MICKHFYFKSCSSLSVLLNYFHGSSFYLFSRISNLSKPWYFKSVRRSAVGFQVINYHLGFSSLHCLVANKNA